MFIRTYNVLRILARDYQVRVIAFDRTGEGVGATEERLAEARSELGEFAALSIVPVPQGRNRLRYFADHARSLLTDRAFTFYRYREPRFGDLIEAALHDARYEIIHVDSLDLAAFLPLLPRDRVVLTHHNVESELLQDRAKATSSRFMRAYIKRQAILHERLESEWAPQVRVNVTVSDRDANQLRRIAPGSEVMTIPNGVDIEAVAPSFNGDEGLVCVGGLGWFPNEDALQYLNREIMPRLRERGFEDVPATWVGRASAGQLNKYAGGAVRLTGYVSDVYPYLARAACYVMPFRLGGGTRLKLLEAMAAGKAIVTTTVGAMGVGANHGVDMLIAESTEQLVDSIATVLTRPELRRRLGVNARKLVEASYSWEAIGAKMLAAYGSLSR